MIGSLGANTAALKAFGTKMGVTAKNIANVNSEEYKKSRAALKAGPNGNVQVDIERLDTPGPAIVSEKGEQATQKELSNVDLSEEIPEMIMAKHGYGANLQAVKAQDEVLGETLDILG